MDTQEATALLAAVGGGAVLVSGLTSAIKAIAFPAAWQHGRASLALAGTLAGGVVTATAAQLGLSFGDPATWLAAASAWLTVYAGAVGVHQTVTKAARVAGGTTNRAGPDDEQ